MAWAYYKKEQRFYGDDFRAHLPLFDKDRIRYFVEKACKYFKVIVPKITFNGVKWHRCLWDPPRLNFIEKEITLRYLAHELAHHIENQLNGNRRHNFQFSRRVESVLAYLYDFVLTDQDRLGVHFTEDQKDELP